MAEYVVCILGAGTGCDYCIDCNKTFFVLEAENDEDAIEALEEEVYNHYSEDRIDSVDIYKIDTDLSKKALKYHNNIVAKIQEEEELKEKELQEKKDKEEFDRLAKKLGKKV